MFGFWYLIKPRLFLTYLKNYLYNTCLSFCTSKQSNSNTIDAKMSRKFNKERNKLLREAKNLDFIIKSFNSSINQSFYDYFSHLLTLSGLIYKNSGNQEIIELKFVKHCIKFRTFCEKFSKFRKLLKYSISSPNKTEITADKIEFHFDYKEDGTFVYKEELKLFLEKVERSNEEGQVIHTIGCLVSRDYKMLKSEIADIINELNKNYNDINKFKIKLNRIKNVFQTLQIKHYNDILLTQKEIMLNEIKPFYHKVIIKKQETFKYDNRKCNKNECLICLEDFENGKSVTILKCGHLFCTKCIENWLKDSVTCPCCRQNPNYLL